MTDDAALAEQVAYYRARAAEYDVTAYGDDLAAAARRIARVVAEIAPGGRVLEIACGTGLWTGPLAESADEMVAVDAAPEALTIARDRTAGRPVAFQQVDVFTRLPGGPFDLIFFSAWLSHVPTDRFAEFWGQLAPRLAAGGRVAFVDEHVAESPKECFVGIGLVERTLRDGRRYRVVKHFLEPAELQQRLSELGWTSEIRRDGTDWIVGEARPRQLSRRDRGRC